MSPRVEYHAKGDALFLSIDRSLAAFVTAVSLQLEIDSLSILMHMVKRGLSELSRVDTNATHDLLTTWASELKTGEPDADGERNAFERLVEMVEAMRDSMEATKS